MVLTIDYLNFICCVLLSADMSLKAAEEAAAEASAAVSEAPAASESPERLTEATEAVASSS